MRLMSVWDEGVRGEKPAARPVSQTVELPAVMAQRASLAAQMGGQGCAAHLAPRQAPPVIPPPVQSRA